MTFFVTKSLATGPIRFGVAPRRLLEAIDDDPTLSTGPDGSFVRRRHESFFFADSHRVSTSPAYLGRQPEKLSYVDQILALPKPLMALVPIGIILTLLGFAVLFTKGAQGWVEIIFGLGMIAVPVVLTAQQRRATHDRDEKEREEREAREKRNRDLLAAYVAALERMRVQPDKESMDAVGRERAAIDLPDPVWAPAARHAVLQIGFEALHRLGPAKASEVAALMFETAGAAGLHGEARGSLRNDLYRTVLWHLMADDRVGKAQAGTLEQLRKGFEIEEHEPAAEELERLRGVDVSTLPRVECTIRLGFHEYCIHATDGLVLTNKRLVLSSQKPPDAALPKIDDIEVDADEQTVVVRVAGIKKPIKLTLGDPIYTAALIDIASTLNERPRGFA